jgi:hypothetical protein
MFDEFEDNKIKYLIMGALFLAIVILIKEIILRPQAPMNVVEIPSSFYSKNQIDFELLKSLQTGEFSSFYEIFLPKEKGRENPFAEY